MKKKICCWLLALLLLGLAAGCSATDKQADSDPLTGTSWLADNDGSQWVFRTDGSFSWYRDKDVIDDNYYAGNYTAHRGEAAVNYLVEDLAEYGCTREDIETIISQNEQFDQDYNIDNFICFSCDNKSYLLDGQEQLSGEWLTAYYGFLLAEDSSLAIINLRTGSYYSFSRETD